MPDWPYAYCVSTAQVRPALFFFLIKDDAVLLAVAPRRLRRWRAALFPLLAMLALPAAAQPPHCGTFKDPSSGAVLRVYSAVQGERQLPGQAAEPYHLQHDGDQLLAANTASGRMVTLAVSGDGRSLSDETHHYALDADAGCQTAPTFPAGSCRADITTCFGQMTWTGADSWRRWCSEGVSAACNRLIEDYRSEARSAWVIAKVMANDSIPSSPPTVCVEDSEAFDAEACRHAEDAERAKAVGKAFALTKDMPSEPILPDAELDEVAKLCRQQPSAAFCTAVASALRTAGRLPAAREAMQLACRGAEDPPACAQLVIQDNNAPN